MRLGIVGGALQGTEVCYLAREAGLHTLIIDRNPLAPALDLADEAAILDVTKDPYAAKRLLESCDAIIPANEDQEALDAIVDICKGMSASLIFDPQAYAKTSSKIETNSVMKKAGIPMPGEWPGCGYPVIVKPSRGSGSHGVSRAADDRSMAEAVRFARRYDDEIVVQEFVSGPSISLEVIGKGDISIPLQTTQVILDEHYDCKMVLAPCMQVIHDDMAFMEMGRTLGKDVGLQGIMDIEAIVHNGVSKVLELDARFPSQTPSAVYHSTTMNMIGMLFEWYVRDREPTVHEKGERQAIYEHIRVRQGRLESFGEDMMSGCTHLRRARGFHGADVALTDIDSSPDDWRATLITTGKNLESTFMKRDRVLSSIMDQYHLDGRYDSVPKEEMS
ncbi:MAG: 3-methylornithine--L-lysine ligase [Methanomassiliicoccales archaeon PtaU1.Bin124]|nr:MAG: 3-methylornithine--L-lysine ligase [Methanomassiliicoccales archaeon PtaU1.Bin124]